MVESRLKQRRPTLSPGHFLLHDAVFTVLKISLMAHHMCGGGWEARGSRWTDVPDSGSPNPLMEFPDHVVL